MALGDFITTGGTSPAGAQTSFAPRSAILFTSRFRQIAGRAGLTQTAPTVEVTHTANGTVTVTASTALSDIEQQALNFFGNDSSFMSSIAMALNPNSVKFVQPKRFNKKDTREGSVYFHFTNSRGQNQDILTLQFAGNTGNLDLRGSLGDQNQEPSAAQQATTNGGTPGADTGALYKLLVWHNLYLMTREPMLLADGTDNVFSIVYSSALFPSEIIFSGFFSKVLEFEENASKPNSRNYSFEFTVQDSIPDLDQVLQVLSGILGAPPTTAEFSNEQDVLSVTPPIGEIA